MSMSDMKDDPHQLDIALSTFSPDSVPDDHWKYIFSFLSLHDLSRIITVNHLYHRLVSTMPPIGATLQPSRKARWTTEDICSSAITLRRHIKTIDLTRCELQRFVVSDLCKLGIFLPHLTRWRGTLQSPSKADFPSATIQLPQQLEDFHFRALMWPIGEVETMLVALGKLPSLTKLSIMPVEPAEGGMLIPLLLFPVLRSLSINWYGLNDSDSMASHVSVLRELPHLDELNLPDIKSTFLTKLLAKPHHLRWKKFTQFPSQMTDEQVQLLTTLPTLTSIACHDCSLFTSFTFLKSLPNLRSLTLSNFASGPGVMEDLCQNIRQLTQLRRLGIQMSSKNSLTNEHLESILSHLPYLDTIYLCWNKSTIQSLSCFGHGTITRSLKRLKLLTITPLCPLMNPLELNHLLLCKNLEILEIGCFCLLSL